MMSTAIFTVTIIILWVVVWYQKKAIREAKSDTIKALHHQKELLSTIGSLQEQLESAKGEIKALVVEKWRRSVSDDK